MGYLAANRIVIAQGEYFVTDDKETTLSAVLGSCVACCAFDLDSGLGGMNHILLPGGSMSSSVEKRGYGAWLMEMMLNEMFNRGATRGALRVKLFGGAKMFVSNTQPGEENIRFTREFVKAEGYPVIAEDLGGSKARRVHFEPCTGRAWVKAIEDHAVETVPATTPRPAAINGDVDFF